MSKSMSKLNVAFVLNSVYFYINQSGTYFAKKADGDTRTTRISRSAFESAQAQFESVKARSELEFRLYEMRFDMDCIGESDQLWSEISALSDTELKSLVDEYEAEAAEEMPRLDTESESESVPASDPTPATPATVSDPIDAVTRPDWAAQQSFERITMEDLQAIPATVARGLGMAAMGAMKLAAMGIGAMLGLGLMGLRKVMAR